MALNNRTALHPKWTSWGTGALSAFATCLVAIFDPNSADDGRDFNPYTNGPSSAPTELWRGYGQMQVFQQTLNADDVAGSVSQMRSIRFTFAGNEPPMRVRKGFLLRIISDPLDPQNELYEFTVTSGMGSSLAFVRMVEAEADMSVIAPRVT